MGKWNHRPYRRRFFRQEKLPSPSPLPFHPQPPPPSEFWQDGIPQWEKEYITLVGSIPWWKVVDAKKNMYGSCNVLNWDDSAGKEAFQNAKKRFWADINGLHCDISAPASDIYIDEIDWNPNIDPDIVKEVDREYFAPDDEEGNEMSGPKKRKSENSAFVPSDGHNCLTDTPTNPWECETQGNNLKIEAQDWNQGNNCINFVRGDDNPWDRGITQSNERMEKIAWHDSKDKSWKSSWDNVDPWERDCKGVANVKGNSRWGDPLNTYWGCNPPELMNLQHGENPWECGRSQNNKPLTKDRGWGDCGGDKWHWKQRDSHSKDHVVPSSGWGARNDGQKRKHSHQYISGHHSSRVRGSDCETGGYWRGGNSGRRVS